jgi:hypothetical protein
MNKQPKTQQEITGYASVLNAARLLAEEAALRLHELATRYPDALPPELVEQALPYPPGEHKHQAVPGPL